ncbi:AI-2E family transporter [Meiothermus granaticius]|uniref:Sporulation integral membrane protein YtvI n=1 Tax=Meiothermus granaticius NBRC 107808 TaxID=1227551 RepID=A0A399F7Y0_9DEIN|nr:AI-2E family transporter [Meiothermus granaticius]MCL6526439.1 AI-2E family transporter [Thermaceae bacterium]RIH91002.1 sporulation integral membrane protein YtvI [Meiothermus granaticius NBRC 107808]GEM88420.1 AI-2E family transporter [Meiothermus granaticius NBRC 107808]
MSKPPGMPPTFDLKGFQRVLFNTVFLVFGLLFLARVASAVVEPLVFILLAGVLTMGLNPLVALLENRLHLPRRMGAVVVVLGILVAFLGFIAIVLPLFVAQGQHFSQNMPRLFDGVNAHLSALVERYPALAPLQKGIPTGDLSKLVGGLLNGSTLTGLFSVASSAVGLVASTFLLLIVVLFLLMSPEPIVRGLMSGIPPQTRPIVQRTLVRIGAQLGKWLLATLLLSVIKGTLMGIGLRLVGFENALLFGLVNGLTNPIPFLGPWLGITLPVFSALSDGSWQMALLAIGVLLIVEQLDNSVFGPLVMGRTVELHPASMLLGVLVFGAVLGLAGVFLTVPLALIIKALYEEVYLAVLHRPEVSDETVAQVVAAGQGAEGGGTPNEQTAAKDDLPLPKP